MPREIVRHELPEDERVCAHDGQPLCSACATTRRGKGARFEAHAEPGAVDLVDMQVKVAFSSESATARRCARAISWLYAMGLRRAEMTKALCGNLEQLEIRQADGTHRAGWTPIVLGSRIRQVPLPDALVLELRQELSRPRLDADALAESNQTCRSLPCLKKRQGKQA